MALWSARNGIAALFEAMNIAYDEVEERGFIRLTLLSLGFTAGGLLVKAVLIAAIAVAGRSGSVPARPVARELLTAGALAIAAAAHRSRNNSALPLYLRARS
ncbi:YhjD/YihY/BrkB family envelope integrity protein [Sinorhizobium fredii]|uniref:YhjD/YihY/BrkB family envelope integrity protein n=1 Tax=Rhizobium fredii TaxID=380 RepID=UPI002B27C1F2|nr:hypothetical protein [Sinorhizobium fredii]